jgi:hypothetical protein
LEVEPRRDRDERDRDREIHPAEWSLVERRVARWRVHRRSIGRGSEPIEVRALSRGNEVRYDLSFSTSAAALVASSNSRSTCSRVPRSGSRIGTRCRASAPVSKMIESHEAAAMASG